MLRYRIAGIVLSAVLLAGCRIEITVPEGGSVVTRSGSFQCFSGQTCLIDVYDLFFSEDFVGKPDSGYTFDKWKKKYRGLCGGKSKSCDLYTSAFVDRPALLAFLESDEIFYLEPIFRIIPVAPPPPPPSNPYAKYNGTWRLNGTSFNVYCPDGSIVPLQVSPGTTSLSFSTNGVMTFSPITTVPVPGQVIYYYTLSGTASGTSVTISIAQRVFDPSIGIVVMNGTAAGSFTSNTRIVGNIAATFYSELYGMTCSASYEVSVDRIGN
jgi:hypothetical protein